MKNISFDIGTEFSIGCHIISTSTILSQYFFLYSKYSSQDHISLPNFPDILQEFLSNIHITSIVFSVYIMVKFQYLLYFIVFLFLQLLTP